MLQPNQEQARGDSSTRPEKTTAPRRYPGDLFVWHHPQCGACPACGYAPNASRRYAKTALLPWRLLVAVPPIPLICHVPTPSALLCQVGKEESWQQHRKKTSCPRARRLSLAHVARDALDERTLRKVLPGLEVFWSPNQ